MFFVIDDMITQEKIHKLFFFSGGGGGGGVGRDISSGIYNGLRSLTTVDDEPWKLFCKISLNARD